MESMAQKVLVTGGTGLVGAHLLYELVRKGYSVKATKRSSSNLKFAEWVFGLYSSNPGELFKKVEWVEADMLDYSSVQEATRGIDTVFHTSAVVSFNPYRAKAIISNNVAGTANIVDACLENGVKTLCHISSIAALGDTNAQGFIDENCKWSSSKGQGAYALSKFLSENEVWRGKEHGLRVIVVNPSVILGPGRWDSGSGQLFKQASKGQPFYTEGISGFVDVRDVAKAMVVLSENDEISNDRFVLNAENVSYKQLFTIIAEEIGKKAPYIKIPRTLIKAVSPIVYLVGIITGAGGKTLVKSTDAAFSKTNYSSEKIKKAINFQFIPVSETVDFITKVFKASR